jgi:hypothetical protein
VTVSELIDRLRDFDGSAVVVLQMGRNDLCNGGVCGGVEARKARQSKLSENYAEDFGGGTDCYGPTTEVINLTVT